MQDLYVICVFILDLEIQNILFCKYEFVIGIHKFISDCAFDGGNICKTILEIFGYKDGIRYITMTNAFYTFLYNYNIHIQRLFVFFAGCYGTKDSGGKQLLA